MIFLIPCLDFLRTFGFKKTIHYFVFCIISDIKHEKTALDFLRTFYDIRSGFFRAFVEINDVVIRSPLQYTQKALLILFVPNLDFFRTRLDFIRTTLISLVLGLISFVPAMILSVPRFDFLSTSA